jgi:hypothetical protein
VGKVLKEAQGVVFVLQVVLVAVALVELQVHLDLEVHWAVQILAALE